MVQDSAESNRGPVSRREECAFEVAIAAALEGCEPAFRTRRSAKNPEITVTAIARAFSRAFPANSIRAECLRQLLALGAAILFVSLLLASYGLDLSPGFF
jgi:hypothetical protein